MKNLECLPWASRWASCRISPLVRSELNPKDQQPSLMCGAMESCC